MNSGTVADRRVRVVAFDPRRVFDRVGTPRSVNDYLRRIWRGMSDRLLVTTQELLYGIAHARDPGSRRLFDGISRGIEVRERNPTGRYIELATYFTRPLRGPMSQVGTEPPVPGPSSLADDSPGVMLGLMYDDVSYKSDVAQGYIPVAP